MLAQVRHRWETVALSSGASLCATHGTLFCGDGEHRYDVTSYRSDGNVYTTFMVYNKDGKVPQSSFAHEFVSGRPWGNGNVEKALIRFCESRDGGMRSDGSKREDWGGFIRFVEEKTDDEGKDIYGSPIVTALRWMPFDTASQTVKAAEDRVMDEIDLTDDDEVTAPVGDEPLAAHTEVSQTADDDDRRWEEGWDDDDHIPVEKSQSLDDCLNDIDAQDSSSHEPDSPVNGWEVWIWHDLAGSAHDVPSMIVYGQRRLTNRDEALALWEDCKNSYFGDPKMLVRISDNRLTQIEDLSAFTVSIGTGVGFGGRL